MSKLRREMGLRDVTLFAIACIIGTRWIPAAAHAGPGSVTLWLLAALLFVVPLAIAVAALIVKYPGAGGLYLWTRGDFGPWHGFLCFWVYWMGMALWFPSAAMFYMSVGLRHGGPICRPATALRCWRSRLWPSGWRWAPTCWASRSASGPRISAAASSWVLGGLLAVLAALVWSRRGSATPMHFMPQWNWGTLNFWSTIAYAMSGLELAGLMGAEIHDPERTLPRAGWIASAFATVFYSGATIAMLVLLRPEKISELNGYAEVAQAAGSILGARGSRR